MIVVGLAVVSLLLMTAWLAHSTWMRRALHSVESELRAAEYATSTHDWSESAKRWARDAIWHAENVPSQLRDFYLSRARRLVLEANERAEKQRAAQDVAVAAMLENFKREKVQ